MRGASKLALFAEPFVFDYLRVLRVDCGFEGNRRKHAPFREVFVLSLSPQELADARWARVSRNAAVLLCFS
jgi:hypothetical protein